MEEKKLMMKTFLLKMICECGGEFRAGNEVLMSYPPQYPHKCTKCGEERTFSGKSYPRLIHEEA